MDTGSSIASSSSKLMALQGEAVDELELIIIATEEPEPNGDAAAEQGWS